MQKHNHNKKGQFAAVSRIKRALWMLVLVFVAMGIIKVANVYIDLVATNNAHAQEYKALRASKEELAIKEAQHLSLLSDVERLKAEEARKATPIEQRLMLPEMAIVTFYTCDASMTPSQKAINCPNGITATRTKPAAYFTAACDRSNLGKKFNIVGFGNLSCDDTGGAIKGHNRFDIYLDSYKDAIELGTKHLPYSEVI